MVQPIPHRFISTHSRIASRFHDPAPAGFIFAAGTQTAAVFKQMQKYSAA